MNLLIKVDCGVGVVMALKKCMRYKRSLLLSVAQFESPVPIQKQIGGQLIKRCEQNKYIHQIINFNKM